MPQVDLETLVAACAGGCSDQKIACEPLEDGTGHHADSPPVSFWLSGDAEYDWWDRNAVYQRNESTKGNSIISNSLNPNSNNNSQRFSKNTKSKAAIIGLPKPQKASFADAKSRRSHRPPGNARLFPKRSVSVGGGKSESCVVEPSSPKVSCIGRVRSKRDRNRRLRTRQRSISSTATATASTSVATAAFTRQKSARSQRKKTGFFESVRAIFRTGRSGKTVQKPDLPLPGDDDSSTKKKKKKKKRSFGKKARGSSNSSTTSRNDTSFEEPVSSAAPPPGLGSVNRFASGRRSESWGVDDSEIHVAH